jgi:sugar/nucleoside kinase (ribokinase family)
MSIEKFTKAVKSFEKNKKVASGYIALNDLKILDRYLKEAKIRRKDIKVARQKFADSFLEESKLENEQRQSNTMVEVAKDKVTEYRKESTARLGVLNKEVDQRQNTYNKDRQAYEKAKVVTEKLASSSDNAYNEGVQMANRFDTAIENFLNAAKALGVNVKVDKYKKAADDLRIK